MPLALLLGVTLGVGQGTQERQGPHPRSPGHRREKRQAHPSEGARFDEVLAAGAHRVAVDAFGANVLPPPPLQGLVYAHNQRSFGYEGFHEQTQQDAAYLPTRPDGAAQEPMVATEAPLVLQAHRLRAEATVLFPGARIAPATSSWTCWKTCSEKGTQTGPTSIIMVGRVRISITSFSGLR